MNVGAMVIVGSLNAGLIADYNMLYTKSLLDFISGIMLTATMGIGVMGSAAFTLVFQGAIVLMAAYIAPYVSDLVIAELNTAGCLLIFALSTILTWNLFGRLNMVHLFGRDSNTAYTLASLCFLVLGALASTEVVWELSDFFNLLMTLPNVAALFILTGPVVDASRQSGPEAPRRDEKNA